MKPDVHIVSTGAEFNDARTHRYLLWRTWIDAMDRRRSDEPATLKALGAIGLNPSTADETVNDPTIERLFRRAVMWGCNQLLMGNLFALRSTDPEAMLRHPDPVGGDRANLALIEIAQRSEILLVGCGAHGSHLGRYGFVMDLLRPYREKMRHLGLTASGLPRHPLYVQYAQPLLEFDDAEIERAA